MESTESSAGSALQHQPNLPPGFRFHPTDEELVVHYLKKKAVSAPLPVAIIAEVDLYKFDPWELPAKATFGEQEWYFFSPRDRKYPNGARPNRAATSGYWKATGTDKPVLSSGGTQKVGVKKALVFYGGKPPKGIKTNWIMHEYRLTDNKATSNRPPGCHDPANKKNSLRLDDWVLCRIYRKSNTSRPLDHHHHDHDHDHDHRHHHDSIVINDMLGGVGPVGNNQMSMMSVLGPQNIEKLQQPHQQLPKAAEAGISYDHHLFDGMLSSANNGSNTNNTNNANSLAASSSSAATKRGALPGMYWNVDVDEAAAAAGPSKRVLQLDHCHDSTTSTDHLAAAAAETASSSASLATLLSQLPPAAQTPPLHHHQQAAVLGAMGDGGLFQRHFQLPGMNWFS